MWAVRLWVPGAPAWLEAALPAAPCEGEPRLLAPQGSSRTTDPSRLVACGSSCTAHPTQLTPHIPSHLAHPTRPLLPVGAEGRKRCWHGERQTGYGLSGASLQSHQQSSPG